MKIILLLPLLLGFSVPAIAHNEANRLLMATHTGTYYYAIPEPEEKGRDGGEEGPHRLPRTQLEGSNIGDTLCSDCIHDEEGGGAVN